MALSRKEGEHVHCIFRGSTRLLIIFVSPTITLHESALIVSPSSIIAEKAHFKEEEFA
jgi:hypothetical protein